jgi:uncharacterized protein (TIGR00725 family)
MRVRIGVMGSAGDLPAVAPHIHQRAELLGQTIARHDVILLSGATTGVVHTVGAAAHGAGAFHVGVSPASNEREHINRYGLPMDACDLLIFTGFGLKGRNVVLVRSCDIVLFIAGAMGSLNEFTIAYDEGKIIGCLAETGGVADEVDYLLTTFSKPSAAKVFRHSNPEDLLSVCLSARGT